MTELYRERYREWCEAVTDSADRAELETMHADERRMEECFYTELEFGTAGLRGILGMGTNRMNAYVVRRATAGLARFLKTVPSGCERGVAIAYDSRRMSREFARETALTLAARGVKAYLFSTLHSVPQLSYAVRHLKCMAGVVITASHNPPEYNGYKVYWDDGGQAGPAQAAQIYNAICAESYFCKCTLTLERAVSEGLIVMLGGEEDEAYYREAEKLLLCGDLITRRGGAVKIVYTPLNGTGLVPVTTLIKRQGMEVTVVPEQAEPDENFPTVSAPNPEDPKAFALAVPLAKACGANLILATDPDADRLGVAVKRGDGFDVLTGNRIGCILLEYILSVKKEKEALPHDGFMVRSIVSTRMADDIAAFYGVSTVSVPTGFRFISERIAKACESGSDGFLFGFEESYGFLAGGGSRDKDAVSSAMLLCEAAVYYNEKGMTLGDALDALYDKYGFHGESVRSYTLKGKEGIDRIHFAMEALRREPPTEFAAQRVVCTQDLIPGTVNRNGTVEKAEFSGYDVLVYTLESGAWLCVRPSGTEPKLKLYIGARADGAEALDKALTKITLDADARLKRELGL